MPIYEYVCDKCGTLLEVVQKMSDRPLSRCKKCGGKLERIISRSSFVLKGSGWYVTDYARKGSQGKSSESSEESGKASKTSD